MNLQDFLHSRNKIKLGFIGGSITEGSSADRNYASFLASQLSESYSDVEFEVINTGIGGTSSALGLFRLKRDLLSKEPDIVFIEFAVNDIELKASGVYIENMIRSIKAYRSDVPIILLYTCSKDMFADYGKDKYIHTVENQMKLCEHYRINQINIGYILYQKGADISELLRDSVHPDDNGCKAYADVIASKLNSMDFTFDNEKKELLFGRELKNPDLLMCNQFANSQWKLSYNNMFGKLPDYIYSFTAGDEFSFEFSGSFLGIYYTVEKDSGIMEYSVDGADWKECSCWDMYALSFNRPHFLILEEELEDKKHHVKIRNSGRKDEKSEGYYIRLGAFTV